MQTPEFAAQLEELIKMARLEQVAVMCAEAVLGDAIDRLSPMPCWRVILRWETADPFHFATLRSG